MPFCSNCGNENPQGARFCGNCGTEQNTSEASCIKCGKMLEANEKFCSSCGMPVKNEPPIPPPRKEPEKPKYTKEGRKIISGGPKQNQPGNPPPPNASQPQKKKRGCLSKIFRLFILLLVLFVAIILVLYFLPGSSPEDEGLTDTNIPGIVDIEPEDVSHLPENRDKTTEQISSTSFKEEKALKETTALVENAFASADTTQLKSLLTAQSLKNYSGKYKAIQPEMAAYAKALKSKKLVLQTEVYALYSIEDESGNKFSAEFAQVEPGIWKLVRF